MADDGLRILHPSTTDCYSNYEPESEHVTAITTLSYDDGPNIVGGLGAKPSRVKAIVWSRRLTGRF